MKFGGTSVEDAPAIQRTIDIVKGRRDRRLRPVVVVSAMARVTDELIAAAQHAVEGRLADAVALTAALRVRHHDVAAGLVGRKLPALLADLDTLFAQLDVVLGGINAVGELTARTTDLIASFGERLSSLIVAQAFEHRGISSALVDARTCIITDDRFGRATPQPDLIAAAAQAHVLPLVQVEAVPILGGFIAATAGGITTTLGRGGSDYTAALLGRALRASAIEIWTDVNGVMTTDPRICPDATRLRSISFEQASELAYFGAKVLHPATILPAVETGVPVWVLNSRDPANEGTVITAAPPATGRALTSIAVKRRLTVLHVTSRRLLASHGFLRRVFEVLDRHGASANMLASSEVSISIALEQTEDLSSIVPDLQAFADVATEAKRALVCLVGDFQERPGVASRAMQCLREIEVGMISLGANRISMNLLLTEAEVDHAVRLLHAEFFPHNAATAAAIPDAGFAREHAMAWHLV
ncbi:lysine-sensitive aspartokinase 3 [Terriglobus aquaticus]|uniref:Aspartokinase n=1 Tax=Terriglobus aquaticus TaxID=940139 RepID=A0ABW9KGZ6_9BACT|nr:lysine-sensitive aspartokinase 3 [Terriglobus aquaticus]